MKISYISPFPKPSNFTFSICGKLARARFGVFDRSLVESALARPKHAATYENADIIRQAATFLYGLIKNYPWEGGNKRTATFLTNLFLKRNGWRLETSVPEIVELVLAVEADKCNIAEIESWLRSRVKKV